jgi:hypothetical protein
MAGEELFQLIKTLAKPAFVAQKPGYFLLVTTFLDQDAAKGAFHTASVNGAGAVMRAPKLEIFPVQKARGTPFPDRILVGRAGNCDIVLPDPSVSKLHAHLRKLPDGSYEVIDVGSQNGTTVNGAKLVANTGRPLKQRDSLLFGKVASKFVDSGMLYDLVKALG